MSIDWWTFALQTVNVLILIWLLRRFFWRPVAAVVEQRRATTQAALAAAAADRVKAARELAEIDGVRAGLDAERNVMLSQARQGAAEERKAMIEEVAQAAETLRAKARAGIENDARDARAAWRREASRLAVAIAERLAGRFGASALNGFFLDQLVAETRRLPEASRHALATDGVELEAISAGPLTPSEQALCGERLAEVCGGRLRLAFVEDPALIAGLELNGPHLRVSNSWRADLERILTDLDHDERA